jgi:hypothetical protein
MRSLDAASLEHDVRPFAGLVSELILRPANPSIPVRERVDVGEDEVAQNRTNPRVGLRLEAGFRTMFQPSVAAGLFLSERLAGYRGHFIYLDGSRSVRERVDVGEDEVAQNRTNPRVGLRLEAVEVGIHRVLHGCMRHRHVP